MQPSEKITRATITTNKGVIEVSFSTNTPLTVKNFVTLAQSKFYEGVRFHRVIKDFMIQTGDPLSKDIANKATWGTGGPGYKFQDELTGSEQYPLGTLAMANAGPNTNGSQFFIVTANPGYPLPPSYTVFGKVTKGIDVAMKIQDVKTGEQNRPLEDVIIEKVEVME
jgi:cyclophilin family peptidyl-prolyl cis-trans isomerase